MVFPLKQYLYNLIDKKDWVYNSKIIRTGVVNLKLQKISSLILCNIIRIN